MDVLRIVIATSAPLAPMNACTAEYLMERSAAMKKVLSPSSDTTITPSDCTNVDEEEWIEAIFT